MAPVQGAKPRAAPVVAKPVSAAPLQPAAAPPAPVAAKKADPTVAAKKEYKLTGRYPTDKKAATMGTAPTAAPAAMIPPMPVAMTPEMKQVVDDLKTSKMPSKAMVLSGGAFANMTPDQQKTVYAALPKNIRAGIEKEMKANPSLSDPKIWMAKAGALNNDELAAELKKMRSSGGGDHGPYEVSLAAERAARTKWGNANPHIVQHLKEQIGAGKVKFGDGRGAQRTETDGRIGIDKKQANSPEAMAANLAHEATHSYHAVKDGHMDPSVYNEETAGNVVSAQVWAEIGDRNDKGVSANGLETLNEMADAWRTGKEDAVQARMAVEYAGEAAQKGEAGKVDDILKGLGGDPGAQQHLDANDASVLIKAATSGKEMSAERIAALNKALANAPKEAKEEARKHFTGPALDKLQAGWK